MTRMSLPSGKYQTVRSCQFHEWNLPTRPTKASNVSVELDAIAQHLPAQQFAILTETEEREHEGPSSACRWWHR